MGLLLLESEAAVLYDSKWGISVATELGNFIKKLLFISKSL